MTDEYQAQLQRMREATGRRLEAARSHLATVEAEWSDLEAALRVHDQMSGTARDQGSGRGNGAVRKSTTSQKFLIFLILDGAIPRSLSVEEIRKIAKDQHGRAIPAASVGSVLSNAKKAGIVAHRDGKWSSVIVDKPASGESPEAVSSSDGQRQQS